MAWLARLGTARTAMMALPAKTVPAIAHIIDTIRSMANSCFRHGYQYPAAERLIWRNPAGTVSPPSANRPDPLTTVRISAAANAAAIKSAVVVAASAVQTAPGPEGISFSDIF